MEKIYTQNDIDLALLKNSEEWKIKLLTKGSRIIELEQSTMEKNLKIEEQIKRNAEDIRRGFMYHKIIIGEIQLDANSEEGRNILKFLLEQSEEMQKEFNETLERRDELDRLKDIKPDNYFQPIIDYFTKIK